MNGFRPASPDSVATALLTTRLALPKGSEVRPLGPTAWASLRPRLAAAELRPGELIGRSTSEIAGSLGLPPDRASNLALLLSRVGQLSIELDRLQERGIWMLSFDDTAYPPRLMERLGEQAPPILFGAGDQSLLSTSGALGVVGSRDADDSSLEFTRAVSTAAARGGLTLVSGAARGVDTEAMRVAAEQEGAVVGVLADSLEQRIRAPDVRRALADGEATFVSQFGPRTVFSVATAMGRNKLIYCLADAVVVVSATDRSGGTWAGAVEALHAGWVPVLVRSGTPRGLVEQGGLPLDERSLPEILNRRTMAKLVAASRALDQERTVPVQESLFEPVGEVPPPRKGVARRPTKRAEPMNGQRRAWTQD